MEGLIVLPQARYPSSSLSWLAAGTRIEQVFTVGFRTPSSLVLALVTAVMPIIITAGYETGGDKNLSSSYYPSVVIRIYKNSKIDRFVLPTGGDKDLQKFKN